MRKQRIRFGNGIPTAIMLVLVLVLCAFGTLSFLRGYRDFGLTQRSVLLTQGYYKAVTRSEEALMLLNAAQGAAYEALLEELNARVEDGNIRLSFDAGEGRTLTLVAQELKGALVVSERALSVADTPSEQAPLMLYQGEEE